MNSTLSKAELSRRVAAAKENMDYWVAVAIRTRKEADIADRDRAIQDWQKLEADYRYGRFSK